MFSPHLFDHIYDIDTIIAALCAEAPQWLETTTGTLSPHRPETHPPTHTFLIEPLPPTFLNELSTHAELAVLTEADQAEVQSLLQTHTLQTLPQAFPQGRAGGWLRERVKDAALEWLDVNDLIPPSMRHINRAKAARLARTIAIISEE